MAMAQCSSSSGETPFSIPFFSESVWNSAHPTQRLPLSPRGQQVPDLRLYVAPHTQEDASFQRF